MAAATPTTTSSPTAFAISGPNDAPVIVLIHGLGLHRRIWDDLLEPLSDRYRVVSYDLWGHGESGPLPQPASLGLFARQCVELLDHLEIPKAGLVGFSLGGMINRRVAIDSPERVSALGVLNSPHQRSPQAQQLVEERAAATSAGDLSATLDATLERWLTPTATPALVARVSEWVLANNIDTFRQVRQVLANGVTELIDPQPAITVPTLVLTCEHDSGSTPSMAHAIAAEIVGAKTVIVPYLQHLGLLENPEPFVAALRGFLDPIFPRPLRQSRS